MKNYVLINIGLETSIVYFVNILRFTHVNLRKLNICISIMTLIHGGSASEST